MSCYLTWHAKRYQWMYLFKQLFYHYLLNSSFMTFLSFCGLLFKKNWPLDVEFKYLSFSIRVKYFFQFKTKITHYQIVTLNMRARYGHSTIGISKSQLNMYIYDERKLKLLDFFLVLGAFLCRKLFDQTQIELSLCILMTNICTKFHLKICMYDREIERKLNAKDGRMERGNTIYPAISYRGHKKCSYMLGDKTFHCYVYVY